MLNVVGGCHILLSNTLIFASQHKLKALKSYILQQLPNAIDREVIERTGLYLQKAVYVEVTKIFMLFVLEFGVFVNSAGRNSRQKPLMWSRLPLAFGEYFLKKSQRQDALFERGN